MKVGFIGLGKLGLPVATAMAARGLEVYGYDPHVTDYPDDLSYEADFVETANVARVKFTDIHELVKKCGVIFVAVQTPHEPRFEGVTPLPDDRADFDYSHLRSAISALAQAATAYNAHPTVAVISTVLPGTMEREVRPLLGKLRLVYNPSFIAMGTTIRDFLDPEFILLGGHPNETLLVSNVFHAAGIEARRYATSVENAELIKVAYNTYIGLKLAFANTLQEVCHKTPGTDVDEVTDALKLAKRRLISPAYLTGGMGDGGGCHPRDNIALSWLARELDLSYDLFEAAMLQRERHAEWLADLMCEYDLPKGIMGTAYKPGSHIQTGSPALLVGNILAKRGESPRLFDPYASEGDHPGIATRVWLVGCNHPDWPIDLPEGSVVIDPWRTWPDQEDVEVIRVGQCAPPDYGQARQSRELRQAA
jgi:UDPglucose 6-dehydrogenase